MFTHIHAYIHHNIQTHTHTHTKTHHIKKRHLCQTYLDGSIEPAWVSRDWPEATALACETVVRVLNQALVCHGPCSTTHHG
jgi:hypothetical protein